VAELALERMPGDLGQRPGQFHAGRAAADDRKAQPRVAPGRVGLDFGALEREQQSAAQQQRIVECFQTRRVSGHSS
jgi:hypothetical protein